MENNEANLAGTLVRRRFRNWVKRKFDLYNINDLQTWGHCGLCGTPINNEIFPKDWSWGICKKCGSSA